MEGRSLLFHITSAQAPEACAEPERCEAEDHYTSLEAATQAAIQSKPENPELVQLKRELAREFEALKAGESERFKFNDLKIDPFEIKTKKIEKGFMKEKKIFSELSADQTFTQDRMKVKKQELESAFMAKIRNRKKLEELELYLKKFNEVHEHELSKSLQRANSYDTILRAREVKMDILHSASIASASLFKILMDTNFKKTGVRNFTWNADTAMFARLIDIHGSGNKLHVILSYDSDNPKKTGMKLISNKITKGVLTRDDYMDNNENSHNFQNTLFNEVIADLFNEVLAEMQGRYDKNSW